MENIIKTNQESMLGEINLQLFADGSDEGEVMSEEEVVAGTIEETTKEEKTFTQEELNAIVTRESRAKQEKILKDLGVGDFDNAKEGIKQFQEWQESQKTEAEKKDEKLTNLEKEHLSIKSENELLKAQISASKQGVAPESIEDVVVLAKSLVTEEISIDKAIEMVVEKYPHFAAVQEVEEDNKIPRFSTGEHTKKVESLSDPFQAKLDKYKK